MALNKEIIITPLIQEVPTYQEYSAADLNNLNGQYLPSTFVPYNDIVEFFAYNLNGRLLYQDYNFTDYRIPDTGLGIIADSSQNQFNDLSIQTSNNKASQITLLPEENTLKYVDTTGQFNIYYNFFRNILDSSYITTYFIKEISSDRTELRLGSNDIPADSITISTNLYLEKLNNSSLVSDFYLNLGENNLLLCLNLTTLNGDLLIKLYEPLLSNVNVKTNCWFVEEVSQPIGYNINIVDQIVADTNFTTIKGPNYNIPVKDQINNSTNYTTFNSLNSNALSGSYQQIQSLFEEQGIEINVDYSNFENFIFFSSAQERLDNFIYKVQQIEEYSASLAETLNLSSTNTQISSTANYYQSLINNITSKFDGYEYYLYFESGSNTYPKTNTTPPYTLYSSSNTIVTNWYATQSVSASAYDLDNQNWILNTIPSYLREDSDNAPYEIFLNMIGQYFDNIWIYTKDLTNRYNADNRIDFGISKDLVADAIKSFGLKIYQNNYSVNDLYTAFIGVTPSGSAFPITNITSSLPVPANSGIEYITSKISGSSEIVPLDDVNKRIYKRIYHNLPYLVKKKGTIAGLRALLNIYGVPDTILQINEFGGKDRNNSNDWDLWREEFNYSYQTDNDGFIESEWVLNSNWNSEDNVPATLEFRFKTPDLQSGIDFPNQALWSSDTNSYIILEYTGSGYTSGSYSGSITDPYNEYATLKFVPDWQNYPNSSASVYLPFYDGGWWSITVTRESNNFNLFAGNNIYSGSDGSQIGFVATSSISENPNSWVSGINSYFPSNNRNDINGYSSFSGSYQEIRYLNTPVSYNVFEDYVMNPQSIEGNGVNGSYNQLAFRATLGGELYTGSVSVHPKVSGSYITQSFNSDSDFTPNDGSFVSNRNYTFFDSPPVGIKNRNNDKIKAYDSIYPSGNVLSSLRSLEQITPSSKNYTNNLNLLEVAFSPQNEINDDIISQIGYFNIGDYIGDPRLISSSATSYPALDALRNEYFQKYTSNYDVYDYIRLIKFFDNSLFKMIKDFVPTRTGLASGVVVKPTILERQKYPVPQAEWARYEYTGSIGEISTLVDGQRQYIPSSNYESIPIETITGSDGGSLPTFIEGTNYTDFTYPGAINVTQSWNGSNLTPYGYIPFTQDDATEFINGEFSGSEHVVTNGELNPGCDPYKTEPTTPVVYDVRSQNSGGPYYSFNSNSGANQEDPSGGSQTTLNNFANGLNQAAGRINLWWNATRTVFIVDGSAPSPYPAGEYTQDTYKVSYVTINKTDKNGLDLTSYIPSLTVLEVLSYAPTATIDTSYTPGTYYSIGVLGGSGLLRLLITSISEKSSYYVLEVTQLNGRYFDLISTIGVSGAPAPYPLKITNTSNSSINFSPFVPLQFEYSDCNPIYGNELEARLSDKFYDLDYSSNAIQAVNQQVVISASQQDGTAVFAPVQDYNWYAHRSTLPRYQGSRSTSNGFNQLTTEGGFGQLPNVVQESLYFSYFNWVKGTSPEWGNELVDRTNVNIRYFIDDLGNVIEPIDDVDGINVGICQQNFEENTDAILSFSDPNAVSSNIANLIGSHTIFKSGKRITPIIYTQTSSIGSAEGGGHTGSITFVQGDQEQSGASYDFRFYGTPSTDLLLYIGYDIEFDSIITLGGNALYSGGTYTVNQDAAGDDTTLTLNAYLYFPNAYPPDSFAVITLQWTKNGSYVGSPTTYNASDPYVRSVVINYTDATATTGDDYTIRVKALTGASLGYITMDQEFSYMQVNQSPLPTVGPCTRFWGKSGATIYALNNSGGANGLKTFYGQKQVGISGSGFQPITSDFTVQKYDEIRFEGTENQSYKILNVNTTGGNVTLTLDRTVTATNLNYFLLRRYINDPANIILAVDKPGTNTSEGILSPEYLYSVSKVRTSEILKDLKRQQLI